MKISAEKTKLMTNSASDSQREVKVKVGWLVGCFGFNGPLRQYFSLYRAVSQRMGERRENYR